MAGRVRFIFKFLKITALTLLVLAVLDFGVVVLFPSERLPELKADAVLVLGAAPNSTTLLKRTEAGMRLIQEGVSDKLILSGGKTDIKDESEAENMQKVVNVKAPQVKPILETKASSTWENLEFTRKLVPEVQSLVVVTDRYHLARSVFSAKIAKFEDVYWASPDFGYYPKAELRRYYAREMLALPWYFLRWCLKLA